MGGEESQAPTTITRSSSFLLNLQGLGTNGSMCASNYPEIKGFGGFDPSLPFFIFFFKK
jgi:hypothetical protein